MPDTQRGQQWLAVVLAMTAGYVDAFGLLTYQTYLSFMSGNTTQTGSQIGQDHLPLAAPSLLAIVFFVAGVFTGTLIAQTDPLRSQRRSFALVAGLIAAIMLTAQFRPPASAVSIATVSFAMGVMNTTIARVGGQSVNIGFVTGTLNRLASHLALAVKRVPLADAQGLWDTHTHRALLLFSVWLSFLTGALVSGAGTVRFGTSVLLLPLLVLLALAMLNLTQSPTTDADT
jgi:uncharacterized membrane protein YoaK (UPF0700 family)